MPGPTVDDDAPRLAGARAHLDAVERIAGLGSWEAPLPDGPHEWSAGLGAILGRQPSEDDGFDRFLEAVHPADRRRVGEAHDRAVADGVGFALEHRVVRGGTVRRVDHEVVVDGDGDGSVRLVGTVHDVTERVVRSRRLLDVESRRRELLHRLVRASDDARAQLAGDLHDGPVQVLTATLMRIEVLSRTTDDPPAWLGAALDVVRDVGRQLRDVLFDLHPQITGSGVRETVAHLAGTVLPGTHVAVSLDGDEPPPDTARAVHGVVQEAFWDVRETDAAEALAVHLVLGDEHAVVVVDGGAGTRPLLTRSGVLGVAERCEAVGGTAEVDTGGRVLRCTLPIPAGP